MKHSLLNQAQVTEKVPGDQERKILPVCFLCNKVPEQGIRSGFFLRGIFICHACETELINTRSHEKEEYKLAISKLRQILFKQ